MGKNGLSILTDINENILKNINFIKLKLYMNLALVISKLILDK